MVSASSSGKDFIVRPYPELTWCGRGVGGGAGEAICVNQ